MPLKQPQTHIEMGTNKKVSMWLLKCYYDTNRSVIMTHALTDRPQQDNKNKENTLPSK